MGLAIVIGFFVLMGALLYFFQGRLIYYASAYGPEFDLLTKAPLITITYQTRQGRQTAFYLPPQADPAAPPQRLWALFSGNAALALYWLDLLEQSPDPRAGFLMIDYPGYGRCEGSPDPASILESSKKAIDALAARLKIEPEQLGRHFCVMGHSLGAASALQLAARRDVERIVLISPFTSMAEMARRVVRWPLCLLLRHRFDNLARLEEIARRSPRPPLVLLHGSADDIVPVEMSRTIAQQFQGWVEYHEIAGADHNFIMTSAEKQIKAAISTKDTKGHEEKGIHK